MAQENKVFTESELKLTNRTKLSLTGVSKVLGSNENRITAIVTDTTMCVLGNNLRVVKLDTDTGLLEVEGEVFEIKYVGGKGNFFKKLFK